MSGPEDDDREDEENDRRDEQPDDPSDDSPRVTREELRAYLELPETRSRIQGMVAVKVPADRVKDLVHDVCARAMKSRWLPLRAAMKGWVDTITRRQIADETRKRARRKKLEGPMPVAPQVLDEAGLPIEDPGDAVVDTDDSTDPTAEDPEREGWLMRRWFRDAVKDDPKDRETFAMMEEWAKADEKTTYGDIAKRHGLSESALKKRAQRLKEEYLPDYIKWRNGMFILILFGAIAIVVLVGLLMPRKPKHDAIDKDPSFHPLPPPVPPASASAAPSDTPFEPALPTGPKGPGLK
jgi:DNA-directed RNA polymerase specialized sigma24 family protein